MPREGMPKHLAASDKGDLLIEYGVILPTSLTEQQKQGAPRTWGAALRVVTVS